MTPSFYDLAPGADFHDRYELLAFLGQGGFGKVFRARDRSLLSQMRRWLG
jgi:hypothetical protein